jgi:hypothetical protein
MTSTFNAADFLASLFSSAAVPKGLADVHDDPGPIDDPTPEINQADAAAVFPPDVMEGSRAAEVRWGYEPAPARPVATSDAPAKPTTAGCRCGSTIWRDVPIHGGQSVRRDCGGCGRFLDFAVWYGKDALRTEQ